jgi:menaquinone-9 beta-reductase
MEPDCAYSFPNEDGLLLFLAGPSSERLPELRADLEGAYVRYFDALPDAPDLSGAHAGVEAARQAEDPERLASRRPTRARLRRRRHSCQRPALGRGLRLGAPDR